MGNFAHANDIDHTVGQELPLLKRQPSRCQSPVLLPVFLSVALIIVVLPVP